MKQRVLERRRLAYALVLPALAASTSVGMETNYRPDWKLKVYKAGSTCSEYIAAVSGDIKRSCTDVPFAGATRSVRFEACSETSATFSVYDATGEVCEDVLETRTVTIPDEDGSACIEDLGAIIMCPAAYWSAAPSQSAKIGSLLIPSLLLLWLK